MTEFVDATSPTAVEAVLTPALSLLGLPRTLETLAPVCPVQKGRPGKLFRAAEPDVIVVGDRALTLDKQGRGSLQHVVGGIVLATDPVSAKALPGVLASLVTRWIVEEGNADDASVLLTSLRDAVESAS